MGVYPEKGMMLQLCPEGPCVSGYDYVGREYD
jgi:hypothetical protein